MRYRIFSVAVTAAAATIMLAGCSISLTPQILEVPASDIAVTVEDKIEAEIGSRPEVDCGTDDVKLEVSASLTCLLTDVGTGLEYDVVVTFTEVTGSDYSFDFAVADSPNNPPEPTVDPQAPTVTGDEIAALVVTALSPSLPAPPDVSCPEQTVDIVVGNTTYCQFDDDDGSHDVEVIITQYDPVEGIYAISATVLN